MTCGRCGTQVWVGARVCPGCSSILPAAQGGTSWSPVREFECRRCGRRVALGERVCVSCGAILPMTLALAYQPPTVVAWHWLHSHMYVVWAVLTIIGGCLGGQAYAVRSRSEGGVNPNVFVCRVPTGLCYDTALLCPWAPPSAWHWCETRVLGVCRRLEDGCLSAIGATTGAPHVP